MAAVRNVGLLQNQNVKFFFAMALRIILTVHRLCDVTRHCIGLQDFIAIA